MTQPDEQQLLETGRIIALAREIETRMAACGAVGNGLREKSESLRERLPQESERLLAFIGNVRNRVAHEADAAVSAEEFQLFEEACDAIRRELDRLHPDGGTASPAPAESPKKARNGKMPEPPAPENTASTGDEWLTVAARIPGAHLLYAFRQLFLSVGAGGGVMLGLFAAELLGIGITLHGCFRRELLPVGIGATLLFSCWLYGVVDGIRQPPEHRCPAPLWLLPGVDLLYFLCRFAAGTQWVLFLESAIILGVWGGAIHLAATGEIPAALLLGALSYAGALLLSLVRR